MRGSGNPGKEKIQEDGQRANDGGTYSININVVSTETPQDPTDSGPIQREWRNMPLLTSLIPALASIYKPREYHPHMHPQQQILIFLART